MKWCYYIPHFWSEPTTWWEDVYLFPADSSENVRAQAVTVESMDEEALATLSVERRKQLITQGLRKRGYVIEGPNVFVLGPEFDLEGLLSWTQVWLRERGHECSGFLEATYEQMEPRADTYHFGKGLRPTSRWSRLNRRLLLVVLALAAVPLVALAC